MEHRSENFARPSHGDDSMDLDASHLAVRCLPEDSLPRGCTTVLLRIRTSAI